MSELGLLRFTPIFRDYVWGGRRLESMLGKKLPLGDHWAESWEVVDREADQSVVSDGPHRGKSLHQLVLEHTSELCGPRTELDRFPLLFKFLDAHRNLSVQVHPDDEQAAQLATPDLGKTEAWVVLHAEPGSLIYAGLKRGFDLAALEREIHRGTAELCLHRFEPRPGDCVFLPAGTVHALGAGIVVAEIQQSSDATFRIYDWNRLGNDGQPRPLHIEQALSVIDERRGPVNPQEPQSTSDPCRVQLVACDHFNLNRWQSANPFRIGGDSRFHILALLEGSAQIPETDATVRPGDTFLVPAQHDALDVTPLEPVTLLDIT